ncbi:MAG: hypothetical protein M1379_09060 [Firmicutes bacterium]|nr:hypothetical protein [Bacillota bacterium]
MTPKELLILLLIVAPLSYLLLVVLPVRFLYRLFKRRNQRRPNRFFEVLAAIFGALHTLVLSMVVLVPLYFYGPVEWRTFQHGWEFAELLGDPGALGKREATSKLIYLRVFAYQGDSARVLAVEGQNGNHAAGNFYFFKRLDGRWRLEGVETVWTRSGGSANDITIPPYF